MIDIAYIEARTDKATMIEVTNDIDNASTINEAVVTALVNDASDVINAKLTDRYVTPLTETIPSVIKQIAFAIFKYKAYQRRYDDEEHMKDVQTNYKLALKQLDEIANGTHPDIEGLTKHSTSKVNIIMSNKTSSSRKFAF